MSENDNGTRLVAELARSLQVHTSDPKKGGYFDSGEFVILRAADGGEYVEYLKGVRQAPSRKTGTIGVDDAQSFIAYHMRHWTAASTIYANRSPASFVSVLNDHSPEFPKPDAGYRDHRATYTVKHSPEWLAWAGSSGKPFESTEAFAMFLEENCPDIITPDPARMIEIALNFRIRADQSVSLVQRLSDGDLQVSFTNTVAASSKAFSIPEMFTIDLPVFEGLSAPKYRIDCRLRYRLKDQKLSIWYELVRPHRLIELAFHSMVTEIEAACDSPLFRGRPAAV